MADIAPMPVRIVYAALGGGSAPVWVAQEAGIFRDEGLQAEVVLVRHSERVVEGLLDGTLHFGNIAAPAVLQANVAGGDLVYLTGGLNKLVQSIVTRPEITTPDQLRGQRLGLRGGGGLDDAVSRYILAGVGLHPARDLQVVDVDAQPQTIDRMDAGEMVGAFFSPPYVFEAVKRGYRVLVDASATSPDFQLGGLVARRALVDSNPDLVRRVVRAYVRGVHRYRTDPVYAASVVQQYARIQDPEVARQTVATQSAFFQPVPYPTVEGIGRVLTFLAERSPAARDADPAAMADLRWVRELDESGFIARLYA